VIASIAICLIHQANNLFIIAKFTFILKNTPKSFMIITDPPPKLPPFGKGGFCLAEDWH
jgi:hypothetical protein